MNNPRVTIVVVQRNHSELTVRCLKSLQRQTYKNKFVVVYDNGSAPEHIDAVYPLADDVRCLYSNRHFYPVCTLAAADFTGLCKSTGVRFPASHIGDFLCFVTNDTILADTAIERLVREARKPDVGWVSAAYQQGNCWTHCVTRFPEEILAQLPNETQGFDAWARGLMPNAVAWNKTETTAFMIPANRFLRFDESLGTGQHDIDYGIRAEQAGLKMLVAYDAVMWHQLGSPTSRACIGEVTIVFDPVVEMNARLLRKWGPEYRCWWESNRPWQIRESL
jgi:GT2 family glycosyltransferase